MPLIRPATPGDHDAVRAVVLAAYGHYPARLGQTPGPLLDDYEALIRQGVVDVLDDGGRVAGVIVLIPEADVLLLDNVAVDPSTQGRGYGRDLMRHAERVAREKGFDAIRLYTHQGMTENIALYTRYGFTETHRATERDLPRVFMHKRLDPA